MRIKKGPLTVLSNTSGLCTYLHKICVTVSQGHGGVEILGDKQIKDCLGTCSPVCKSEIVYCKVLSSKQLFTIACCTSSTRFFWKKIKIRRLLFACQLFVSHEFLHLCTLCWESFCSEKELLFSLSWSRINPAQVQNKREKKLIFLSIFVFLSEIGS